MPASRALEQDTLQILPSEIDVAAVKRTPQALDRHMDIGLAVRVDEFQRIDRVVNGAQAFGQTHASATSQPVPKKSIM